MPFDVRIPVSIPRICAPREELLKIFEQSAAKQFIYIQAPAGYGKTISTLLWLKKAGRSFSWVFLDKYDNKLSLFYRSFCRTLLNAAQAQPEGSKEQRPSFPFEALSQFVGNPSFSAAPVENTMEFLSMAPWNIRRISLVIDDLHNISNDEILKSLPFVFKRMPDSINVFILSRTALPEVMHSIRENGNASFIGIRELAFTPGEIRNYFIEYGLDVTAKKAGEIFAYTGGWAIILNAMLLSDDDTIYLTGNKYSLQEYIEKNIWNGFDEKTKAFLLKTSIVDSFTPELCALLTENPDSPATLETLIGENVNLSRIGSEYRYHNLFLEFLQDRLQKSDIDQKKLYAKATGYYLSSGQFLRAAVCSMHTDDSQLKMQVIQVFFQSKNPALEQFLELSEVYDASRLPEGAFDRAPILYMPNILSAFLRGETEKTINLFDKFYASLPSFINTRHPIAGSIVTRLLQDFRVKLADLDDFMNEKGIKRGEGFPGQAAVVTIQMPLLHRSVRDFSEFLDEGVKEKTKAVFSCILPGNSEFFYCSVTAGLLTEQNRLGEALEVALGVYGTLDGSVANEIRFGVALGLAEIYSQMADIEKREHILSELRGWIGDNNIRYLAKNLSAYEERLKIQDGDRDAAEAWLENYFVGDGAFGEFYKIYQNFTTVRAFILLGMTPEALTALEHIKMLGESMERPLDVAEANVLIAIVEWVTGKKTAARDRLCRTLSAMRAYGFIRIIANEGKAVLPVIAAVLRKLEKESGRDGGSGGDGGNGGDGGSAGDYDSGSGSNGNNGNGGGGELRSFIQDVYVAAYEQSKRMKGITFDLQIKDVKLSPKQSLVLGLLSKGRKNAEIVKITGMSINTIREHTRVAYKKLEVNNAMDAIVKAKRLGLLREENEEG